MVLVHQLNYADCSRMSPRPRTVVTPKFDKSELYPVYSVPVGYCTRSIRNRWTHANNEKIKCFRVMDEEGKIINKDGHEKLIPVDKLKKMYETMVTINEADQVFNAAQR